MIAVFDIRKHCKLSIALEVIFENGYGARRGLSHSEILVLDAENEIKAIIPIGNDGDWDFVRRADLIAKFAKLGVVLK